MPDLSLMGMQPLPLWTVAALLAVLLIILTVALRRSGAPGSTAAMFGIPAMVVIAWSAWNFAEHSILRQQVMEREALDARALQLTAAAIAPGSPLACLDNGGGDAGDACEAAVFLRPETVAAATAYVEARLRLLADSLEYGRRVDPTYYSTLTQLRAAIEADRYGFVAHVLATRDRCTADACGVFDHLRDPNAVKANLRARTFERNITRYAVNWPAAKSSPVAAVSPSEALPTATISGVPVTRPIDFPSAASIPPVSIMTPAEAAPQNNAASAPPARRPAANPGGAARAAPPPAPAPAAPRPQ